MTNDQLIIVIPVWRDLGPLEIVALMQQWEYLTSKAIVMPTLSGWEAIQDFKFHRTRSPDHTRWTHYAYSDCTTSKGFLPCVHKATVYKRGHRLVVGHRCVTTLSRLASISGRHRATHPAMPQPSPAQHTPTSPSSIQDTVMWLAISIYTAGLSMFKLSVNIDLHKWLNSV